MVSDIFIKITLKLLKLLNFWVTLKYIYRVILKESVRPGCKPKNSHCTYSCSYNNVIKLLIIKYHDVGYITYINVLESISRVYEIFVGFSFSFLYLGLQYAVSVNNIFSMSVTLKHQSYYFFHFVS